MSEREYSHENMVYLNLAYQIRDIVVKWGARYVNNPKLGIFIARNFGVDSDVVFKADIRPGKQTLFILNQEENTGFSTLSGQE